MPADGRWQPGHNHSDWTLRLPNRSWPTLGDAPDPLSCASPACHPHRQWAARATAPDTPRAANAPFAAYWPGYRAWCNYRVTVRFRPPHTMHPSLYQPVPSVRQSAVPPACAPPWAFRCGRPADRKETRHRCCRSPSSWSAAEAPARGQWRPVVLPRPDKRQPPACPVRSPQCRAWPCFSSKRPRNGPCPPPAREREGRSRRPNTNPIRKARHRSCPSPCTPCPGCA